MEPAHLVRVTCEIVKSTDAAGHRQVNDYSVSRLLGEGSYGKVKLCTLHGANYALKIFNKAQLRRKRDYFKKQDGTMGIRTALEDVHSELEIVKKLNHKNIVRVYEILHDEEGDKIYIVMDYCAKGQIMDWDSNAHQFNYPQNGPQAATEAQVRTLFKGMALGIQYLHGLNVVHRDIKPQNIYLTECGTPKIGDFGLATEIASGQSLVKTVGTFHFLPPECCCTSTTSFEGKPVDIWALGLTLYAMVYGCLPFWAEGVAPLFEIIQSFELNFPQDRPVSQELVNLIAEMLSKDPRRRSRISDVLAHPWLLN